MGRGKCQPEYVINLMKTIKDRNPEISSVSMSDLVLKRYPNIYMNARVAGQLMKRDL